MYSIADYRWMIRDRGRFDAYSEALRRAVTPGCVVADIGAGTGIFSVLACRFGARRVFAIEPAFVSSVLREVVAENGVSDLVECYAAFSDRITLPERADVIISDLRGALPLYDHNLRAVIDARRRHLAPGGTLIAAVDTMRVAVVSAPALFDRILGEEVAQVTFASARRYISNDLHTPAEKEAQLLTAPASWCEIDYRTIEEPRAAGAATWTIDRDAVAHGVLIWFDCMTAPGIGFSNAPGAREGSVYRQRFLPWPEPVALGAGGSIALELHADPVGDDYLWRWNTTVSDRTGKVQHRFRQSTFFASPLRAEQLALRSERHCPARNEEGEIAAFVLDRIDGRRTLGAIADDLCRAFPDRFPDRQRALDRVGDLSVAFSRRPAGSPTL